jgi:hypothetical protein
MIGAEELEWHGLGGVIVAHETSRSSLRVFYLCIVDCQVPQALLGAIEAKGISWRLILRPATKVTRDLGGHGNFFLVHIDPLNLPMRHDWVAVHAERFAPIAGG